MNPSNIARNASFIARMANIAARIANGDKFSGGQCADGNSSSPVHTCHVNGSTTDVDIDVGAIGEWNRHGTAHANTAAQDVFATASNSVIKLSDGTAGFEAWADYSSAFGADQTMALTIVYGSDASNANTAVQGISSVPGTGSPKFPTDAEITTARGGNNNWVRLCEVTLTRTGANPGTAVAAAYNHEVRLDSKLYELIDTSVL